MKWPIIFLSALASFWLNPVTKAQLSVNGCFDNGKNQVSEGLYSHFSGFGSFEKRIWGMQAGFQLGLHQPQNVVLNSFCINPFGKVTINNTILEIGGEYLWTAITQDLRETNWIVSARTILKHWQFGFGTSFRTYRLSTNAANDSYLVNPDSKIIENWNMIYNATYLLKPHENKWNLSGSFTNYDHFIIQQENNPMYNLRFDYRFSKPLSLYSELWYKPAGLMVIRVTYFGMFIRMGVTWRI